MGHRGLLALVLTWVATVAAGVLLVDGSTTEHVAGYFVAAVLALTGVALSRRTAQRQADESGDVPTKTAVGLTGAAAALAVAEAAAHAWYLALAWS